MDDHHTASAERSSAERRGRSTATVAVACNKLLTLVYYGLHDGHIRALAPAQPVA